MITKLQTANWLSVKSTQIFRTQRLFRKDSSFYFRDEEYTDAYPRKQTQSYYGV
jgi:hypothetical protein